jgi:hypothetical protein
MAWKAQPPGWRPGGGWHSCASDGAHTKPEIAKNQATARFRSLIRHLHGLGPRATGEFLAELGRVHSLEREIVGLLEEFAALDPLLVDACDGRDWPPLPLEVAR